MILVLGATGHTGRAAVKTLVAADAPVRVVTRDSGRARTLTELRGADIFSADSSQTRTLSRAFDEIDQLLLIPPTAPNWDAIQASLIDLAVQSGVRHIVKVSVMGASPDEPSMSLRFHWEGEQHLRRTGVTHTLLRPNSFFQNALADVDSIARFHRFPACGADTPLAKVDARDVGEVAAQACLSPRLAGSAFELTGPGAITAEDIAELIGAALGRTISCMHVAPTACSRMLEEAGVPGWFAEEISNIYGRGFYRTDQASKISGAVSEVLDRPARSFEEFLTDYRTQFR